MVFGTCGTVLKQMGILRTVAMLKTIITLATFRTLTLLKTLTKLTAFSKIAYNATLTTLSQHFQLSDCLQCGRMVESVIFTMATMMIVRSLVQLSPSSHCLVLG